ncbi:MAG: DUF4491 family protein [Bacilli bacterium]|jgi:Na+/H+ antiporter NhaD/arsenite permease-like protein|nr:DUF4491 family protein [Bacilli bacterium]
MNFYGVIIAIVSFIIIGIFHPIVIKSEYYIGKKVWPLFLILGIFCIIISMFLHNIYASIILGVIGCSWLWSIGEIKEQEERVKKGWFPANPNKND